MEKGLIILLGLFLTWNLIDRIHCADIVLIVEENALGAKGVIPPVVTAVNKDATVTVIEVKGGTKEKELCSSLWAASPRVVIDATIRPHKMVNEVSSTVKRVCRTLGVPTLSLSYGPEASQTAWLKLSAKEQVYLTQLSPPGDTMAGLIQTLAKEFAMTNVAIVYDNSFVMGQRMATMLQNKNIFFTVQKTEDPKGEKKFEDKIFSRLVKTGVSTVFIFAKMETIKSCLSSTSSIDMMTEKYTWIIVTKDKVEGIECSACSKGKFLFATPIVVNPQRLEKVTEMVTDSTESDLDKAFFADVATMVTKTVMDPTWPAKLTFPKCPGAPLTPEMETERATAKLMQGLKKSAVAGAFGDYVLDTRIGFQKLSFVLSTLEAATSDETKTKKIGTWDAATGKATFNNRPDLAQFKSVSSYRVTTVIRPPFVMKRTHENGTTEFYGFCIDMLNEIKKMEKFEYTIFLSGDEQTGTKTEYLKWTGMMKDLTDNKADIALGPISVLAERELAVDFTIPFYDLVGISILLKKPPIPYSLFKFLTVLEPSVWGCILASFLITSFLLYFFDRMSPYSYHNNREKYKDAEDQRDFNLKECLWFCLTSLTPQGGGEAPLNLSGRLVAATWWLFGFIIIASYTANLAAFLTVSRLDSTIDSLETLSKQYKIKYAPPRGSAADAYFKSMSDIEERFYEIWKNMSLDDTLNATERSKLAVWDYPVSDKYTKLWWTIQDSREEFNTYEEGVARVLASKSTKEGFAMLADATAVRYAAMTNCELAQVGNEFARKPLALAVQKGSHLKGTLSAGIKKLLANRYMDDLKVKWWDNNPENKHCDEREENGDGINLDNIGGIFMLTGAGIAFTLASLLFEYWFFTLKEYQDQILKKDDIVKRRRLKREPQDFALSFS